MARTLATKPADYAPQTLVPVRSIAHERRCALPRSLQAMLAPGCAHRGAISHVVSQTPLAG